MDAKQFKQFSVRVTEKDDREHIAQLLKDMSKDESIAHLPPKERRRHARNAASIIVNAMTQMFSVVGA